RIGSQKNPAARIFAELFGDGPAVGAVHTAMDGLYRLRTAEKSLYLAGQVVQGVPVLGKDDEFTRFIRIWVEKLIVLEDGAQLDPFAVGVKIADPACPMDQLIEIGQFGVELLDRACSR